MERLQKKDSASCKSHAMLEKQKQDLAGFKTYAIRKEQENMPQEKATCNVKRAKRKKHAS